MVSFTFYFWNTTDSGAAFNILPAHIVVGFVYLIPTKASVSGSLCMLLTG